jgi:hypothetical protein
MKKMMLISLEKPMTSKDWWYYIRKRRARMQKEIEQGIKEVERDLKDLRESMKKEE